MNIQIASHRESDEGEQDDKSQLPLAPSKIEGIPKGNPSTHELGEDRKVMRESRMTRVSCTSPLRKSKASQKGTRSAHELGEDRKVMRESRMTRVS
ncbi:MAG: hypothetical protein ACRDF4_11245, partial [Rhabdochlamydiaceae bacterium]